MNRDTNTTTSVHQHNNNNPMDNSYSNANCNNNDYTPTTDDTRSVDDLVSLGSLESDDDEGTTTQALARRENNAVRRVRRGILTGLAVAAVVTSAAVWHESRNNSNAATSVAAHHWPQGPWRSWPAHAQYVADEWTALAAALDQHFPNVTLPLLGTDATWMALVPVITNATREEWQAYAPQHVDEWSSSWQQAPLQKLEPHHDASIPISVQRRRRLQQQAIRSDIFDANGASATGPGPYFPVWQMTICADNDHHMLDLVNLNLASVPAWRDAIQVAHRTGQATWGSTLVVDNDNNNYDWMTALMMNGTTTPSLSLVAPLVSHNDDKSVVALLVAVVPWITVLSDWHHPPIVATVQLNATTGATFDLTNEAFVGYTTTTTTAHSKHDANTVTLDSLAHNYTVTAAPRQSSSWRSVWRTAWTAALFGLAAALFTWYDNLVARRQRVVLDHAIHSSAIVSSLFPEQVRDRLFRRSSAADIAGSGASEDDSRDDSSFVLFEPTKQRLRSFLDHHDQDSSNENGNQQQQQHNSHHHHHQTNNRPIADLFPYCTVLFADIAGFTAWSSLRDPPQVFLLLENVYQTFDKIARKRGVFKVETVGDSYVAVTGLPDPQDDHAVIMCRFARDCRARMNEITRNLELTLGPDTADLKMRFGMHSGPVTAGVLRGEKSRFQLFGDTVNTAARMESTGERDKIQLSQTTADLILQSGKGHWIKPREQKVHAKGKGELQTYWFHPVSSRRSISSNVSDDSWTRRSSGNTTQNGLWGAEDEDEADDLAIAEPDESTHYMNQKMKHQRLIDWNVDLLAGLLKQVVARRRMLQVTKLVGEPEEPPQFHRHDDNEDDDGHVVLDEVVEAIPLPDFDPAAYKGFVDPATIDLGQTVMAQLKRYVAVIAAMYRTNPFHNFEHASHVTLSVNKLLQRIVTPEFKVRRKSLNMNQEMASDLHHYTYGITSDPLTQLAVVFAALIHDVDHWGISNSQLVKEGVPIALKYRNQSVAEQNSFDLAWDLLLDEEEYGDLLHCFFTTQSEYNRFRQVVVNIVMATDIFDPARTAMRQKRWNKAFGRPDQKGSSSEDDDQDKKPRAIEPSNTDMKDLKATIVIEYIMQASDVAHTMQHWHVYQKWNRRLFDELYTAYRAGRMGVDPSTFWVEGELKFFDSYIIPLAQKLQACNVFGVSSDECLNYALNNRSEWKSKGAQIVQELVHNYHLREEEEAARAAAALAEKEAAQMNHNNHTNNNNNGNKSRKSRGGKFARRRSLFTSGG